MISLHEAQDGIKISENSRVKWLIPKTAGFGKEAVLALEATNA